MKLGPGRVDRVHPIADRTEPRVIRALGAAFERLRERVPVSELERAFARGDARMAGAVIDRIDVADALAPVAEILRDAFARGGKVGAEEV